MDLFHNLQDIENKEIFPGYTVRFIHSERMTLAYWTIREGAALPEHSHPHEQVCNVFEGRFQLTIDGETKVLEAGSVAVIPSESKHSAIALTDCRVMDVFQPVREDYQ